jgi:TonB family protein
MDTLFTQLIDVFNWIIRSSAYAVVTIALVALAQFACRRRLPARWLYALWLILLVRMILPFGLESRWSLLNFLPAAVYEDGRALSSAISNDGIGVSIDFSVTGGDAGKRATPPITPRAALSLVWLAGTLVMIAVVAVNNLRLWRSVRKLRQATDQSLLELFEDCKQLMRVRTIVGLMITDRVKSPSLFGCFRPRVLLPADLVEQIPREELRFIFLHELAHIKQGDIWIGWITALLQSLHWFNPLVWWAFARMRDDREVVCDTLALSRIENNEENERYGGALVGLLERFHYSRRLPVVAGILENKAQLKRRLNMITNFKPSTRREIIAAAALLAVLSIGLLTNPQTLLSQSNEQPAGASSLIRVEDPKTAQEIVDKAFVNPVRVGGVVMQMALIHSVPPVYPQAARSAGIAGVVELEVTVDEEGNVTEVIYKSGPAMLRQAAIDAVRQWRYEPALFGGTPVPVKGVVRVTFSLGSIRSESAENDGIIHYCPGP